MAKLFARHMKVCMVQQNDSCDSGLCDYCAQLKEQCSFLAAHITPLAVATPTRLKQLLDSSQCMPLCNNPCNYCNHSVIQMP